MFGMMIDAGPKFYAVRSPTPNFYNVCFCEASDELIHVWHGDRKWSKILSGTIPNPVHDL